jgi:hypothetical protein
MGPEVQIFFANVADLVKKNTQQTIQVVLKMFLFMTSVAN